MPLPFLSLEALQASTPFQNMNTDVAIEFSPSETSSTNTNIEEEIKAAEVDVISKRLIELQEELLTSLKEDISDWIAKTLGVADINADNFIHVLDTGIILCKLSMAIEKKAQECFEQGIFKDPLPNYKVHCDETACSGSWYSRDNTANFLKWCRAYGMTDETLFDSEDLVTHHQEKQVIYCLMELARMSTRFGVEPPSLISMEKEIDSQIMPSNIQEEEIKLQSTASPNRGPLCPSEPPYRIPFFTRKHDLILDSEVYKVSAKCQCEDQVKKLSEGVFNVYGKRVFIRLLQGKHVMVRVGGGWDTFENYLLHHDPVQVFRFSHKNVSHCTGSESNAKRHGKKRLSCDSF